MVDKNVYDIFCQGLKPLEEVAIVSDWRLWSTLSEVRKGEIRRNFNIPRDEELIYIRDTSFWDSGNQGVVFTDRAFYACADNDKPQDTSVIIPWSEFRRIECREDALYIYLNDESGFEEGVDLSEFIKEYDKEKRAKYGEIVSEAIARVIAYQQSVLREEEERCELVWSSYQDEYWELVNSQKYKEAADLSYGAFAEHGISGMLTYALVADPDPHHAIRVLEEQYPIWEEHEYTRNILMYLKPYLQEKSGDILSARVTALSAWKQIPEDALFDGYGWKLKECALSAVNRLHEYYSNHFFELPYQQRKLLMVVDEYTQLGQNQIAVLRLAHLQSMTFPMGHPQTNQLYVAHPLVQSHYIPFESYEIELIKDRVHEFCSLMECMGATSISIDYQQATESENEREYDVSRSGGANVKSYSVEGKQHLNETKRFMQSIGSQLNLQQTYQPFKRPYLPNNLIWYSKEPTWQRLVEQRTRGSLISHTESIETSTTQVVNNDTLSEIEAELKVLLSNANLQISSATSEKLKQHENVVLRIHVEFAPLTSLQEEQLEASQEGGARVISSDSFSEKETEYIELLHDALSDGNGVIDASVKKMLSRFAAKLGVSPERAAILEQLHSLDLSSEEQEYLEEVKAIVSEDGGLSSVSLRLLKRFAEKLGISPDRADFLNRLVS
ncbi:MAG: hypothetical protein HXN16_04760 [Porphyromonas sp.]|jgi:hypothetical protein|uniref:hypothetical protein n=1 Tax=Porphyromonas sp. TaxID=1924944 RepID=UPI001CB3CC8C|nr:hypothetical protein [Porphyromonas sp.]MBF1390041.1 hypothetical protein [Porphyromonas sp.]